MNDVESSVVKSWLFALPRKQQSVVLLALRGCDGLSKNDPSKALVRWYRRTVLNNADHPDAPGFGTFMLTAAPNLTETAFLENPDNYPVHWLVHFLHGAEIISYKHPDADVRAYWSDIYRRGVHALHMNIETEAELDQRLARGTAEATAPVEEPSVMGRLYNGAGMDITELVDKLCEEGLRVGRSPWCADGTAELVALGRLKLPPETMEETKTRRAAEQAGAIYKPARDFAVRAHGDQKYGRAEVPYVTHLDEVHEIACELGAPANVRIAAYLHDVLEDTSITYAEIGQTFGLDTANLVLAVTDVPGKNRTERHLATYPQIREAGPDAVLLKLCNRIANARASVREYRAGGVDCVAHLKMYVREHSRFKEMLYHRGEHETAWAYLYTLLFESERDVTIKGVQLDRALKGQDPR